MRKESSAFSRSLFSQKAPSQIFDWILNAPLKSYEICEAKSTQDTIIKKFFEVLYLSFTRKLFVLLRVISNIKRRYFAGVVGIDFVYLVEESFFYYLLCFLFNLKTTFSVLVTFREILFA